MKHIDRDTQEAARRFLSLISNHYDVEQAIVYGSRARGTHRPDSDADVAVLLRGEHQRFLSVKLDMADTAFDVLLETGILISPLPIWRDEWEHPENYSNPALLRNIYQEGVRLYGSEKRIDHDTQEAVRRFLALISVHYDVDHAIVYGSRARGTHRPDSDADVAVLLNGEHQRVLPTTLAMADVAYDVLLETGINISPLPIWMDEWEHPENYSNPALLRNIDREGVRLAHLNLSHRQ